MAKWKPHLQFNEVYDLVLAFAKRSKSSNVLTSKAPVIVYNYIVSCPWSISNMDGISSYTRFERRQDPEKDRGRTALNKLLAGALRSHFMLFEKAEVSFEPQVFVVPDISSNGRLFYGIVYQIETADKIETVISCEKPIVTLATTAPKRTAQKPLALSQNEMSWLKIKSWRQCKTALKENELYTKYGTLRTRAHYNEMRACETRDGFPYGKLITYPVKMKGPLKLAGCMWCPGLKSWFIPPGLPEHETIEYLDYVKREMGV